jgi:uncharacterized membrane protein
MLLSFTDFQMFKEMMIDFKKCNDGENFVDFAMGIEKADIPKNFDDEVDIYINLEK